MFAKTRLYVPNIIINTWKKNKLIIKLLLITIIRFVLVLLLVNVTGTVWKNRTNTTINIVALTLVYIVPLINFWLPFFLFLLDALFNYLKGKIRFPSVIFLFHWLRSYSFSTFYQDILVFIHVITLIIKYLHVNILKFYK